MEYCNYISVLLLAPGDLDVAFDLEAASMRAPTAAQETRIVQNAPVRTCSTFVCVGHDVCLDNLA